MLKVLLFFFILSYPMLSACPPTCQTCRLSRKNATIIRCTSCVEKFFLHKGQCLQCASQCSIFNACSHCKIPDHTNNSTGNSTNTTNSTTNTTANNTGNNNNNTNTTNNNNNTTNNTGSKNTTNPTNVTNTTNATTPTNTTNTTRPTNITNTTSPTNTTNTTTPTNPTNTTNTTSPTNTTSIDKNANTTTNSTTNSSKSNNSSNDTNSSRSSAKNTTNNSQNTNQVTDVSQKSSISIVVPVILAVSCCLVIGGILKCICLKCCQGQQIQEEEVITNGSSARLRQQLPENNSQWKKTDYQLQCQQCCAICLDTQVFLQTNCRHCYHPKCIWEWHIKKKGSCPLCKSEILGPCKLFCNRCHKLFMLVDLEADAQLIEGGKPVLCFNCFLLPM